AADRGAPCPLAGISAMGRRICRARDRSRSCPRRQLTFKIRRPLMRVIERPRSLGLLLLIALLASVSTAQHAAGQGIMRISVGTPLGRLDPARTSTGEEYIYDNLVFNGLTRMRADLSIEPELAEHWDYTPDLKSWTFHLRHSVKFHNGREMTAEDVIATFKHI